MYLNPDIVIDCYDFKMFLQFYSLTVMMELDDPDHKRGARIIYAPETFTILRHRVSALMDLLGYLAWRPQHST